MNQPILYLLVRTDMSSMNPGKAIAQGSHGVAAFLNRMHQYTARSHLGEMLGAWKMQTNQGFGTTIVLGGSMDEIAEVLRTIHDMEIEPIESYLAEIVVDPTYPVRDGDITHELDLPTGAYVFCTTDGFVREKLRTLELFP